MKFTLIKANENDIDYIKRAKLYNIYKYVNDLSEEEISKINKYADKHIPLEAKDYKMIICDNQRVGCYLVVKKDDGIMLDEIFIDEKYRDNGIGTKVISGILKSSNTVYLWVYKDNVRAISLYKKLGFNVVKKLENRFYMKYLN